MFWPVATETVVLSDPRMIGTNIALCVEGSMDIVSCYRVVSGDGHAGDVDVQIVPMTSCLISCCNTDVETL